MAVQLHMSRQGCAISHNNVVANDAIMRDVGVSHEQVVIANFGDALVLLGAPVQGRKFTDRVTVAYFQPGYLGGVLFILRVFTYRGKLINPILFTNGGRALDDNM